MFGISNVVFYVFVVFPPIKCEAEDESDRCVKHLEMILVAIELNDS